MAYIFVVPRPGVRVRHPDTGQALAPGGERVVLSSYWRRREKDGDVSLGTISAAPNKDTSPDAVLDASASTKASTSTSDATESKPKKRS